MLVRFIVLARFILVSVAVALALHGAPAHADGSWLDAPTPVQWNTAGAAVPPAPAAQGPIDPRCSATERPAETPADAAVKAAGWRLTGAYQGGWGVLVLAATSDYDGMCRPVGYQDFVFVNGVFAGTVSPQAMASRTDGAAGRVDLLGAGQLAVQFSRYAPSDPLCCPSATTMAMYSVVTQAGSPVLTLTSATTSPTSTTMSAVPQMAVQGRMTASR